MIFEIIQHQIFELLKSYELIKKHNSILGVKNYFYSYLK
jgi:hypothetical protein